MDLLNLLGITFTALVLFGSLLQGVAAAFDLIDRWKNRKRKSAFSIHGNADNGPQEVKEGHGNKSLGIRFTQHSVQKLMFLTPYYAFFPHFILVTSYLYRNDDLLFFIATISLYTYFYIAYPFLVWRTKDEGTAMFLKTAFGFLCFLWAIAGIAYGYQDLKINELYINIAAVTHAIVFTVIRFSLLHYIATEIVSPWYKSLPEA